MKKRLGFLERLCQQQHVSFHHCHQHTGIHQHTLYNMNNHTIDKLDHHIIHVLAEYLEIGEGVLLFLYEQTKKSLPLFSKDERPSPKHKKQHYRIF